MKEKDLISVIVPVYNVEPYLEKCVNSIINQTYGNLEIILVNDGSTDKSGEMCDDFAKKDNRIKVIHKQNGGQASARNFALDIAKGEYISFVDSDDYIELEMYETMLGAIKETESDIALCGRYNVSENYNQKTESFTMEKQSVWLGNEIKTRYLTTNKVDSSPADKLFSKELFDKNNVRFPTEKYVCEDMPAVFKLLFEANSLVHVGKAFYNYYQRHNSTSRGKFSEKTYGILIYSNQVRENIKKEHTDFFELAQFFYATQLQNFISIIDPKKNRKEYRERRKELLKYSKIIKKYANRIIKRNFLLIKLNFFHFLLRLKNNSFFG